MAIAFRATSNTSQAFAAATQDVMTLTASTVAGNLIAVVVATVSVAVSSVTDSFGNTYVKRIEATNGTSCRVSVWTTAVSGTGAATSVTVNLASGKASITVGEYSGVISITGSQSATNSGSSTAPTISITLLDANNWVIAGIAANGLATLAANIGNQRLTSVTSGGGAATNERGSLNDNTAASGAVINAQTLSASEPWAVAAFELRTVAVFDPALMVAMNRRDQDTIITAPQVVASGMTPPENLPT
jgi:hypothetical protein